MAEIVYHPLQISDEKPVTFTLKELSRQCIIRNINLRSIQQVEQLPLPGVVQQFIKTFRVPEDFDTSDENVDYHARFLNHWHHSSHQVHVATCNLTGSKVLLARIDPSKNCLQCEIVFRQAVGGYELPANRNEYVSLWCGMNHTNLMNCILPLLDEKCKLEVYALDFPLMNLKEFVEKASEAQVYVTDFLVWETLSKLTSVLVYLVGRGVVPWDLCQLEHVVLTEDGEVKLENLLLYLPAMMPTSLCSQRSWNPWPPCFAPELQNEEVAGPPALVWALGFMINELIKPLQRPRPPVTKAEQMPMYIIEPPSRLTTLISQCTHQNPADRPTLADLHRTASSKAVEAAQGYTGPRTLLQLLG